MNCVVIIMAKAPILGLSKTRLLPALGIEKTMALAQRLLRHSIAQVIAADLGPVEICCTPDTDHPIFAASRYCSQVHLTEQCDGDLGARMLDVFSNWLHHADRVLLIGTDAPALDADKIRQAAEALLTHDVVFVPAFDGGYALVGMRRLIPALFDAMPWSSDQVMIQSRQCLQKLGIDFCELEPVADIDEEADLAFLPEAWLEDVFPLRQPPA